MSLSAPPLFAAQAVDGPSAWYKIQGGAGQEWHAFLALVTYVAGTGTIKLECSTDGTTPAGSLGQLTASGTFQLQLPPGLWVRFNLSGSAGANINAWVME